MPASPPSQQAKDTILANVFAHTRAKIRERVPLGVSSVIKLVLTYDDDAAPHELIVNTSSRAFDATLSAFLALVLEAKAWPGDRWPTMQMGYDRRAARAFKTGMTGNGVGEYILETLESIVGND